MGENSKGEIKNHWNSSHASKKHLMSSIFCNVLKMSGTLNLFS